MLDVDEDELEEVSQPGPWKFIKAGLVAILQVLVVLLLVWFWWQAKSNSPAQRIQKMINENK